MMSSDRTLLASRLRGLSLRQTRVRGMVGAGWGLLAAGVLGATSLALAWGAEAAARGGALPGAAPTEGLLGGMGLQGLLLLGLGLALLCAGGGGLAGWLRARREIREKGGAERYGAVLVEARVPESRNLVLAAAELEGIAGVSPATAGEVRSQALGLLARRSDPSLLPLGGVAREAGVRALAGVCLLALSVAVGAWPGGAGAWDEAGGVETRAGLETRSGVEGGATSGVWEVVVAPPAYTGEAARRYLDPTEIRALAGSRVEVRRPGGGEGGVAVETARGVHDDQVPALHPEDGYLLLRLEGGGEDPHLVALRVEEDPLPTVEVRRPGGDLLVPHGEQVLELEVRATDDRGLEALELRFLQVTGFGERWSFEEGTVPLEVERISDREWRGRARWDLAPMALGRGEAVVYRAVARDRRPEGGWGSSETWTVEVMGGGSGAVGGFAGEDEITRYALSQQVILALTERLQAGADTLSAQEILAEARTLAAGQRRVRAEFVFMLGGELEDGHLHGDDDDDHDHDHDHGHDHDHPHPPSGGDGERTAQELHEEAHARADADAAEGRLQQEGRIELVGAIQWMAAAATFLDAGDLEQALTAETEALERLQRAFSASRYILRALPDRERPDPERRLTGERAGAVGARVPSSPPRADEAAEVLQELLRQLRLLEAAEAAEAEGVEPGNRAVTRASLAATLLRHGGADPQLRELAGAMADPSTPVSRLSVALSRALAARLPLPAEAPPTAPARSLLGAWDPGP